MDSRPANGCVRSGPTFAIKNIVYLGTEEGMFISFDGGAHWQAFRNGMPPVSVHDIRMQPQTNDLVIATHGRAVYVMDDMGPVQELQQAVAHGTWLFSPRPSYEWIAAFEYDEGTYTNYAADNPPYGVVVTFYQTQAQTAPPKIEILNSSGRTIRTVSGTHKVGGKDTPYVSNKAGLNRYVWSFGVDGPVKWLGAARERYQGPNAGPSVPPGSYSVRLTLGTHAYVRRFVVKPDPRSQLTQADYQHIFATGLKLQASFSLVDTMLNHLDDVTKAANTDLAAAQKAQNTALVAKLNDFLAARKTLFDTLTADYHNDEDGIQRPGALREDVQSAYFGAQGLPTQPVIEFIARINGELRDGAGRYNSFVSNAVPAANSALQAAGMKPLPSIPQVTP